jgi:hypothetical protein
MERGSAKHGRRLDEQLRKETRPIVQGGHDPRAEEWKSAEPSGEDQPVVDLDGAVDERTEVAGLLGKEIWPATGSMIQRRVREQHGPDWALERVDRLPEGRVFDNFADLWASLTGRATR